MAELEQYLEQYNNSLAKGREAYRQAKDCFGTADGWYETLARARVSRLQEILKEKGLAVCAGRHYDSIAEQHAPNKIENPTAEDLGIYPRKDMKIRFAQGCGFKRDNTLGDSTFRVLEIELLCPKHFSEGAGLYSSEHWPDWPLVVSELVREKGRYTLEPNGVDVTGLIKWAKTVRNSVRLTENLKGNPSIDIFIYRHFNIPDLPERASFDQIR